MMRLWLPALAALLALCVAGSDEGSQCAARLSAARSDGAKCQRKLANAQSAAAAHERALDHDIASWLEAAQQRWHGPRHVFVQIGAHTADEKCVFWLYMPQ